MSDLPPDYEINEADIDKMIRHLKLVYPEDTITPEMAIDMLEQMQENFHKFAHAHPEIMEKWHEELNSSDTTE